MKSLPKASGGFFVFGRCTIVSAARSAVVPNFSKVLNFRKVIIAGSGWDIADGCLGISGGFWKFQGAV
jgi:hypothetical protein